MVDEIQVVRQMVDELLVLEPSVMRACFKGKVSMNVWLRTIAVRRTERTFSSACAPENGYDFPAYKHPPDGNDRAGCRRAQSDPWHGKPPCRHGP